MYGNDTHAAANHTATASLDTAKPDDLRTGEAVMRELIASPFTERDRYRKALEQISGRGDCGHVATRAYCCVCNARAALDPEAR